MQASLNHRQNSAKRRRASGGNWQPAILLHETQKTGSPFPESRFSMSVQTGLLRDVSRRVLRRDATEDHDIGNRVAAQTVRAMHAAGDFTSRIQTRDRLARFGQHFSVRVDLQTAHRVMDARRNLDGVVRSGIQRGREGQAAKLVILLVGNRLVPSLHRRGEGRRIDAELLSQLLKSLLWPGILREAPW